MRWAVAVLLLAGSSLYLYRRYEAERRPPPPEAPAAVLQSEPRPFLSEEELGKIRRSAVDGEPGVRSAALELLFMLKDPEILPILEKVMKDDPEAEIRLKAVRLLSQKSDHATLQVLIKGLQDNEKEVRTASLRSLGQIGDPAAAHWVTAALRDFEPEVRMEALHTLGLFQEKRVAEYNVLAEKLRRDYETAVKRARQKAR